MSSPPSLRVMTYNVKGLHLSRPDVVAVVRAAAPDVLGIQEPTRGLLGWWRMWRFARAVGMRAVVNGYGARTTALLVGAGPLGDHPGPRCGSPNLSGRTSPGAWPSRPSTASGSSSCTCPWSATNAPRT